MAAEARLSECQYRPHWTSGYKLQSRCRAEASVSLALWYRMVTRLSHLRVQ